MEKFQVGAAGKGNNGKRGLGKKELIEIEKRQTIIPDPVMKEWLKRELYGAWMH